MNFHSNDPAQWLDVYDPLQISGEPYIIATQQQKAERPAKKESAGDDSSKDEKKGKKK